jgi:hypothetical protein
MRHALAPAALVLLALQVPAFAQNGPDIRYVTAAEAEVRALPSGSAPSYPTNRLQRGMKVEIVHEEPGGWLKITPPQRSFSYINTRFLEHMVPSQPNYVVALEGVDVPVYIGSEIVKDKPTIVGVRLKRGAQVTSIGRAMSEGGETLMPIEPPHGEVRYIRAEAVSRTPPTPGGVVAAGTAGASAGPHSSFTPSGPLTPSSAPSANPRLSPEQLWQQAMAAQRAGQTAKAIRLFNQVSVEAASTNPQMAATARQWVAYLQNGYQGYGAGGNSAPVNPVSSQGGMLGRTYALGSDASAAVRLNPPPGSRAGSNTPATPRGGVSGALPPGWVAFRGRLREAGRAIEGVKTYVVEMEEQGYVRPVAYANAAAGVDLRSQVGKVIEVQGPAVYRGDIRTNYMTVMRVLP